MKINEIFGSETPIRLGHPTKLDYRRVAHKANIGRGSLGFVRDNPIDAHLVAKRNVAPTLPINDGYYRYIEYVVEHNLAEDNIHFPRVYRIQLLPTATTDKNKNFPQTYFYRIDLEKLEKVQQLQIEEVRETISRLLNMKYVEENWGTTFATVNNPEIVMNAILIRAIKLYLKSIDETVIKDEKFKEALDVVKKLKHTLEPNRQYDAFEFDTHTGNYMFRRTSVGVQLVIVDPLV